MFLPNFYPTLLSTLTYTIVYHCVYNKRSVYNKRYHIPSDHEMIKGSQLLLKRR